MTPLEMFENLELDRDILSLSPNNHSRRKYVREHILTEVLIRFCVENLHYSPYHICTEIFKKRGYVTQADTIIDFCKEKNIKTLTSKERSNEPNVRKKYETTCLKKHGATNSLSKDTCGYLKKNKTVKTKYNVDNVFQLKDVKEKSTKTMIEKYGVSSTIFMPTTERNYGRRSKIHKIIENILIENNIEFESEAKNKFTKYNQYFDKLYSPIVDILIEKKKIVIEINGDMWHGNPRIYKSTDLLYKWNGLVPAIVMWKADESRNNQIREFGYDVIVLWEYDIRKNLNQVKELLYDKIFKN